MNRRLNRRALILSNNQFANSGIDVNNYLTIEALEDGLTAKLSTNACEYCIDGDGVWLSLPVGTATQSINQGQTLSFRGNLVPNSSNGIGTFTISKTCNLSGNCMSMLFGDNAESNFSLRNKNYAFYKLFYNCTTIIEVSKDFLPATTLADSCYYYMFNGCASLTTAPELPATTLVDRCYQNMFVNCTTLTTAPDLPATTLANYCCYNMFYGCTSLTTAPELPATTLAEGCYRNMFQGCTSLTTAPELPATTLVKSCYDSMFKGCTSLTTAPELPATTLADYCYQHMFYGCTSLTTSPELPATTLADYCYYYMFSGTSTLPDCSNINFRSSSVASSGGLRGLFAGTKVTDDDLYNILPLNSNGKYYLPATTLVDRCYYYMFRDCTSLTTAPELPATTLVKRCYDSMFYGCTSLTTAPELPATTLVKSCYDSMFYNCSKLNRIQAMFTTTPGTSYTSSWLSGVASSGTFVKNKYATWNVTGESGIPSGWTVQTA